MNAFANLQRYLSRDSPGDHTLGCPQGPGGSCVRVKLTGSIQDIVVALRPPGEQVPH